MGSAFLYIALIRSRGLETAKKHSKARRIAAASQPSPSKWSDPADLARRDARRRARRARRGTAQHLLRGARVAPAQPVQQPQKQGPLPERRSGVRRPWRKRLSPWGRRQMPWRLKRRAQAQGPRQGAPPRPGPPSRASLRQGAPPRPGPPSRARLLPVAHGCATTRRTSRWAGASRSRRTLSG